MSLEGEEQIRVRVAILIVTRQRPTMLEKLLKSLGGLSFSALTLNITVVVVDNDPKASACQICADARNFLPYELLYLIENRTGIPFARNRAVAAVVNQNDCVVFVDDDETVEPNWLEELILAKQMYRADIVAGPVMSVLPPRAPDWAHKGRLFDHLRYETGKELTWCGSGNVLISAHVFLRLNPWFDERLALTGGSDRQFFQRASQAGLRIVWTDKAIVREEVPSSRIRIGWVIKRMFRQGISNAFSDIDLSTGGFMRLRIGMRGAAWIVLGIVLLPLGMVTGTHRLVQYARYVAYGFGQWSALRRRLYNEYKMIHGQ